MNLTRICRCFLVLFACFVSVLCDICGEDIRTPRIDIDHVFGMWYVVGYAQHYPDTPEYPSEMGCITMFVNDVTYEQRNNWLGGDRTMYPGQDVTFSGLNPYQNYQNQYASYSGPPMNPYPNYSYKQKHSSLYGDRRLRVLWNRNGRVEEQTYEFLSILPGSWKKEQSGVGGHGALYGGGMEPWRSDNSIEHPEYIYVLKSSPSTLVVHHCSPSSDTQSFTMVLRRRPSRLNAWDWYEMRKLIFSYNLPDSAKYSAVCAACRHFNTMYALVVVLYFVINKVFE